MATVASQILNARIDLMTIQANMLLQISSQNYPEILTVASIGSPIFITTFVSWSVIRAAIVIISAVHAFTLKGFIACRHSNQAKPS